MDSQNIENSRVNAHNKTKLKFHINSTGCNSEECMHIYINIDVYASLLHPVVILNMDGPKFFWGV